MHDDRDVSHDSVQAQTSDMETVLDELDRSRAAETAKVATRLGVSEQDPLWLILRALIEASGNVDQAANRLFEGLDQRHEALAELAKELNDQIGRTLTQSVHEAFVDKIKQIRDATAGVNKTISHAQSQTRQSLHDVRCEAGAAIEAAANARGEAISNQLAKEASAAISKIARTQYRRKKNVSLGRVGGLMLLAFGLGGVSSLTGVWLTHRVAPLPIKTCYRVKGGAFICQLNDSRFAWRMPHW